MSSAVNIYSADPAFPVLADGLLGQSKPTENDTTSHNPTSRNNWSLKDDWLSGLKSSNRAVFRSGAVLGFSRLQGRSNESNEYIAQIPRYLLTKQLRSIDPSQETSAFIIHPGSFEGLAPRTLLNDLQSSSEDQPGLSREEAIKRLDSVQLLPVHSFVNAAQAIGKVSEVLQGMKETQEQSSGLDDQTKPPIILIVAGLDYLAEGVIRSSNPAKGAAFLTATLRTLSRLSRVHASRLSIMLVNTSGLGTMNSAWDKYPQSTDHQGHVHGHGETRHPLEGGIYSIFHSDIPSLFPTLLMKALDQGIDTHLLLSDSKGCEVVEVIKDRTGGGLGKWGIWRQH
ncbi:hypothetical protein N7541_010291 [Penicillium brevicompactum]|uniref:Uncharacterized protein n=1 Tax=Penicillium brevicompactum TaxID=5074 RepID=A0A9W9UHG3_PENBR|nr:hypothetical protein N7541_010291 [Penicillium brevicompactum]